MNNPVIEALDIDKLEFHPKNKSIYRTLVDKAGNILEESIEDLLVSMEKIGQREPITVVQHDEHYQIVSGNRRFAAARCLRMTHLDAIVIPEIDSNQEDILIVSHNLTREKSCAEKLAEFAVYKKLFDIKDTDIDNGLFEFTVNKDEKTGRQERTIKDFAAKLLNMGTSKLQELLTIQRCRPDLIGEIDAGRLTVHKTWQFVRNEKEQSLETIPLRKSDPDFNTLFDSEHKYADTILETFKVNVRNAKQRDKFSLVSLLNEAITFHEKKLDAEYAIQESRLTQLFDSIDDALQANRFVAYVFDDAKKYAVVAPSDYLETEEAIVRETTNGKYNRATLQLGRELVLRRLFTPQSFPQIKIDKLTDIHKSTRILGDNEFEYFKLFSERYTRVKELKAGNTTPMQRRQVIGEISRIDKRLRVFLRIICKFATTYDATKPKNPKSTRIRRKSK
jgi:hypothetical protein